MRAKHLCLFLATALLMSAPRSRADDPSPPIRLEDRSELFVDDLLIERLKDVTQQVHRPEPGEVVLITDQPWEGNICGYFTVFQDDDLYRMYYRGDHYDTNRKQEAHPQVTCYAESRDGIHWTKPELNLFEFQGSTANNIVWIGSASHNFTPFKDLNPACPAEAKYKALGLANGGLGAFQSADGIHWKPMQDAPVITDGAFDSQNLAFWDAASKCYRAYWRIFKNDVRDIRTATSRDFLHWEPWQDLDYGDAPHEHLYTNAILPYQRAPHLLLGFPTRYLPDTQQVEPTFMASRDGVHWRRWLDAVIPLDAPQDRDGNRSNYMAWGMLSLPQHPNEYSMYATEAYYTGPDSRLRRFTYRQDGFVSLRATSQAGEVTTKPVVFSGRKLVMNCRTAPEGWIAVEIRDAAGNPVPGFRLEDCDRLQGDAVRATVSWRGITDLGALANQPVRLRFAMREADIFSLQFSAH